MKENCAKLFKRWKELKEKFPKAQRITTKEYFKKQPPISSKKREEFYILMRKLKNECLDFLKPAEKNELEK